MSLFWVLLATAVTFGLLFALISYSLLWLQRRASRQFEQLFQDANQILQTERPPATWVQSEHHPLKTGRRQHNQGALRTRLGARAKRRCLRQLRALIQFLENGRFYDSPETRDLMVDRLWAIHEQWLTLSADYFTEP